MGVRLAIDDFGTGYSNMSYLRRLPVQTLKIDRSFVAEVGRPDRENDTTSVQILAAMVSLGHALGLGVTAEGVETSGRLSCCARLAVLVQGWWRPARRCR
jgi:EAL domain-containing protein (putative c-di-GMP-specific phosphodiesterase class I)